MDVVRAWKDPHYRAELQATGQGDLPAHPAGVPGLERFEEADLDALAGAGTEAVTSLGCCNWYMSCSITIFVPIPYCSAYSICPC